MPEAKLNLTEKQKIYMSGSEGPFKCGNCEYYIANNACNETHIIALAKDGKFGLSMNGPHAKVDPNGCSDYYEKRNEDTDDYND